jgi:hypothetical protein
VLGTGTFLVIASGWWRRCGAVGGYFFLAAGSSFGRLERQSLHDAKMHADRAHQDQKIAAVGAAVGRTLVVAAIVRFILRDSPPNRCRSRRIVVMVSF